MAFSRPVIAGDIEPNSILRIHLDNNAVGSDELADDSVTNSKIAPGAVSSLEIGPDSITETHVSDTAITTPAIAAYAITAAKLAVTALDFWVAKGMRLISASLETNASTNRGVKIDDDKVTVYNNSTGAVAAQLSSTAGSSDLFVDHVWIKNVLMSINETINEFSIYSAFYNASIRLGLGATALLRKYGTFSINDSAQNAILSVMNAAGTVLHSIVLDSQAIRLKGNRLNIEPDNVYLEGTLPTSIWQRATPLMIDGSGKVHLWNYAPQRTFSTTVTVPTGTVIAAGAYWQATASFSVTHPGDGVRAVWCNMPNFPNGSARLVPRINSATNSSAIVRVVNTGTTSTTLSGALTVEVFISV